MFLFDECVDAGIYEYLIYFFRKNEIHLELDDLSTFEYLKFNYFTKGIDDTEVLDYAFKNKLILITEDKDFGELVYRMKYPHCGIVLIRIKDIPRSDRISLAASTIFEYRNELKNNFSVIANDGIKIKKQK